MWAPPHPDTRIEEYRSWLRRHRDARGGHPREAATSPVTGESAIGGRAIEPNRIAGPVHVDDRPSEDGTRRGGSVAADALISVAAGLAKGAIGFQVVLMATVAAGQIWFGGPAMAITGHSMEPSIAAGSAVLTAPAPPTGPMPGDIISFDIDGSTVTHRVVERDGDQLTTRGDANPTSDSTPIHFDDVIASARLVVPFVGLPNLWLRSRALLPAASWIGANVLALMTIGIDKKRSRSMAPSSKAAAHAPLSERIPATYSGGRVAISTQRIPRLPPNLSS